MQAGVPLKLKHSIAIVAIHVAYNMCVDYGNLSDRPLYLLGLRRLMLLHSPGTANSPQVGIPPSNFVLHPLLSVDFCRRQAPECS